jgi:hypothetical protein
VPMLIQRTRRHRRWAGVALFAALLLSSAYRDRNEVGGAAASVLPPADPQAAFEPASNDMPGVSSKLPMTDSSPQGGESTPTFTSR